MKIAEMNTSIEWVSITHLINLSLSMKALLTAEYHFEDMHGLLKGNELLGNVSLFEEKGTSTIYYYKDYTDIETDILFCLPCHSMAYYTQT